MSEVLLLERTWKNSTGGDNYWRFTLRGDIVFWRYYNLFDACSNESSSGGAHFGRDVFQKFLEDALVQQGEVRLNDGGGTAVWQKKSPGQYCLSVYTGFGDSYYHGHLVPQKDIMIALAVLKKKPLSLKAKHVIIGLIYKTMLADDREPFEIIREDYRGDEDAYYYPFVERFQKQGLLPENFDINQQ